MVIQKLRKILRSTMRTYRKTLITISCFFGVIVAILILYNPLDDDDLWGGNDDLWRGDYDGRFASGRFLSPFFRKRQTPGLKGISCYRYLPMENDRGNPQRYQLERPSSDLKARDCRRRIPHGLVIGVKKCGTTAMTKYMGLHPMISSSPSSQPGPQINDVTMIEWVERFQLTSSTQMSFTGYPGLFTDMQPQLLQMLRGYLPSNTKLILMLRDPVQRLISDYVHTSTIAAQKTGDERKHYEEHEGLKSTLEATVLDGTGHVNPFASLVRMGMYAIDLRSLYQHISPDRVLIIDGNAFTKDPFPSLLKVEQFLQLIPFFKRFHFKFDKTKNFYCANVASRPDMTCLSSHKGRKHPTLSEDLLKKLYDFYRPHNQELQREFGLNMTWFEH